MDDNNAPRMEMRALLAVVLSMLVLTVYQFFFVPPPEELPLEAPPLVSGTSEPESTGVAEPQGFDDAASAPPIDEADIVGDLRQRLVVRATDYVATLDSRGGVLEGFVLPGFIDTGTGEPVNLVHPRARAAGELPLRVTVPGDPALEATPAAALFSMDVEGGRVDGEARVPTPEEPVRVTMRWRAGGWDVAKTLVFPAHGYQIAFAAAARAPGNAAVYVSLGPGLNVVDAESSNTWLCECAPIHGADGVERLAADDVETPAEFEGQLRWAGVESLYFLSAFLLDAPAAVRVERFDGTGQPTAEEAAPPLLSTALRISDPVSATLFLGPKKYDVLTEQGYGLDAVVDFGMFGIIARPLLALLNWIQGYVANYGVAIILLTVLLRLVFLPLNHRAMVSMRRTQKLQPQMAAIRAKYKGAKEMEKRQKMNEEVMELYRREGVSPFGGCLPMLAQMPILFAFYAMLSVAIELRGAPFVLWVQDLSKHDPYLVLPLLMGGSMIVQQRMTPTAGINPAQARMMNLMPVMFTVLFLYVPSGLVLYWLVNNLLGIAQQTYVMRRLDEPAPEGKAPKRGGKGQGGKK